MDENGKYLSSVSMPGPAPSPVPYLIHSKVVSMSSLLLLRQEMRTQEASWLLQDDP